MIRMKYYIYSTLLAVIMLVSLLFGTNPRDVSSLILIAPFIFIFLILFFIAISLIRLRGFTRKSSLIMAAFMALLPTVLLVLQSIGQLTVKDVITIIALFAIAYFHTVYMDSPANK